MLPGTPRDLTAGNFPSWLDLVHSDPNLFSKELEHR